MSYYIAVPLLALVVALQSSVIPQMRVAGGQPDLVFLIVLLWAAHADLKEGVFWAFVGGIFQDLQSITPLGTSTLAMLGTIYVASNLFRQLYHVNFLLLTGFVIIGTIIYHIIIQVVLGFSGVGIDITDFIRFIIAPTIVYNLILMLPIYWFLRRIQKRLPKSGPSFAP